MELYNGDCLEVLKDLSDNSIDFICSDLPFGRFKHLSWDKPIDLEKMWKQLWRVAKPNCPIFLFGDFKFAIELYNSQPKHFKYEIVWNKCQTTTPLLSRKRFGKATEYILVFYKKQPVYNYAKYHKIIRKEKPSIIKDGVYKWEGRDKTKKTKRYNPRLPTNVIDCSFNNKVSDGVVNYERCTKGGPRYKPTLPTNIIDCSNEVVFSSMVIGKNKKMYHAKSGKYEPRLPINIIDCSNEVIDKYSHLNHRGNKLSGKCNTYQPKLPINVIDDEIISNDTALGSDWCGGKCKRSLKVYDPRLPINVIKCHNKSNSKTIKKLTEKPQYILEHLLKYFSNENDVCLDICMGSGSLGVACNKLNRKFIGIEKNKEFFSITKERLNKLPVHSS